MKLSGSRVSFHAFFCAAVLTVLFTPRCSWAQGKGSITGHTLDPAGAVVRGAQVTLTPGGASTATNDQGQFTLSDLPAGEYTVTISYVGFAPSDAKVTVTAGQVANIEVKLKLASNVQEVVVSGHLEGEAEAVNVQRTSDDVINVITADQITSLPNANIADSVGRLPGVSLERDEGEGKYVQVRGTEPRLTNVTLEGINLPSPEVAVRQVKLDVIPADLVESIELEKTLSADQDGEGIGGTVNLKLKNAGDQPTLILTSLGGYTPIMKGREIGQTTATVGDRFGTNKKFGALLGFTFDYNGRGIDDIEPAPDPGYATPTYDSIDIREYRYQRTRWGLGGGSDYRLSNDSDVYLHYFYSDFKDYGNKWVYTLNNNVTPDANGNPTFQAQAPVFKTSQRVPDYSIGSISGGGKHTFSSSWLAWDVAVSNGRENGAAGNPGVTFGTFNGTVPAGCVYSPALTKDPYRPQFGPGCDIPGSPIFDPTQYSMTEFDTSTGPTDQVSLQGSATFGKNYTWAGHNGTLEFGAKIRNSHDYQNAVSPIWDPNGNYLMSQFLSGFKNPGYYDGSYTYGPVTSYGALNNFFNQNPQDFTEDVSDTHLSNDPSNYNLTERVTAGYIMNTLRFGHFSLQTGLRLEATQLEIQGFETQQDVNGNWIGTTETHNNQWYVDPLPSVQLRYQIGANSDIRAVYGRGISRPNPYDLVPYIQLDSFSSPPSVALGNPNLHPEHANDFDLLFEHFLQPYGVVQAGFFYKQLIDPIYYTSSLPQTTGQYAGYSITQIINGSNAYVGGVELAYIQHLGFLPGALSGLGMYANYTGTFSQANGLPGRTDTPALQRQAPNSFNLGPSYDYGRLSLHIGMTYNSSMIYQYQFTTAADVANLGVKGPAGDVYLYPHFQLDAQATFRVHRGLTFLAQGENINNEVFGFYYGSPIYVAQREYYQPTISFGIRWEPFTEK